MRTPVEALRANVGVRALPLREARRGVGQAPRARWVFALSAAVLCVAALFASSTALAQRRVALTPLDGSGSSAVERVLERALGARGFTVVRVERSAQSDAEAAAIARDADVQAVIGGSVVLVGGRRRRLARVAIRVRDASGAVQSQIVMRVRASRVSSVARRVAAALGELDPAGDEAPASAAPEEPPEPPRRAPAPRRARAPREEPAPVQALVQVGAGMRSRAIELLAPDGLDAAYRAEPYFELTARAEARLFDIAFVRARFGSSVGLTSEREDPSLGTVATSFLWLRADAGASAVIDDTVEVGGAFGVGWDRYELAFNELVPTAEYLHLRPALLTSFRVVERLLALDMEAGVRFALGVGDLESLHGREHEAIGADVIVRLRGVIDPGFAWALEGGARRYWLTFTRPDGVVSGTDSGWHLTAWAGWQL